MRDVLPPESARRRAFVDTFAEIAGDAGYGEVITPLLEDYGVFARVGDATDLVQKEMYRFTDNGGRDVALRPEFTAAVCRAFVEHRPPTPWKVWCGGPLLRYERPQRGRYRQFDQVNLEVLGSTDPMVDVEVIALGWRFFQRLGLREVTLLVNSLGTPEERAHYIETLRRYFTDNLDDLSDQSVTTLARNPLRVLDSKRPEDAELIAARAGDRRARTAPPRRRTSRPSAPAWSWSASRTPSPRASSAGSTTTSARRSSSPVGRSTAPRTRSAAADVTTASSKRSAARRHLASGSPSGSTARCWLATTKRCSTPGPSVDVFVVDTTGGAAAWRSPRSCAAPESAPTGRSTGGA